MAWVFYILKFWAFPVNQGEIAGGSPRNYPTKDIAHCLIMAGAGMCPGSTILGPWNDGENVDGEAHTRLSPCFFRDFPVFDLIIYTVIICRWFETNIKSTQQESIHDENDMTFDDLIATRPDLCDFRLWHKQGRFILPWCLEDNQALCV